MTRSVYSNRAPSQPPPRAAAWCGLYPLLRFSRRSAAGESTDTTMERREADGGGAKGDGDRDGDSHKSQSLPLRPQAIPFLPNRWFDHLPDTDHIKLFLSGDWAASPLGPLECWAHILRFSAVRVLTDSQPACLFCKSILLSWHQSAMCYCKIKHPAVIVAHPPIHPPLTLG